MNKLQIISLFAFIYYCGREEKISVSISCFPIHSPLQLHSEEMKKQFYLEGNRICFPFVVDYNEFLLLNSL